MTSSDAGRRVADTRVPGGTGTAAGAAGVGAAAGAGAGAGAAAAAGAAGAAAGAAGAGATGAGVAGAGAADRRSGGTGASVPGSGVSAARRYREVTDGLTRAVGRMRAQDGERAKELAAALPDLHEEMGAAADREALTVLGVALQWEAAVEELWHEQWMTLRPLPTPDAAAVARDLDYLDAVVARRYEALIEAVRRRTVLGRR